MAKRNLSLCHINVIRCSTTWKVFLKKGDAKVSNLVNFGQLLPINFIKLSKLLVNIFCYLINHAFDYMFRIFA